MVKEGKYNSFFHSAMKFEYAQEDLNLFCLGMMLDQYIRKILKK